MQTRMMMEFNVNKYENAQDRLDAAKWRRFRPNVKLCKSKRGRFAENGLLKKTCECYCKQPG